MDLKELVSKFENGQSIKSLARESEHNSFAITRKLIKILGKGRYSQLTKNNSTNPLLITKVTETPDQLMERYAKGETIQKIANRFKCSTAAIRNRLENHPRWDDYDIVEMRRKGNGMKRSDQ